jgi:hypothetical protein
MGRNAVPSDTCVTTGRVQVQLIWFLKALDLSLWQEHVGTCTCLLMVFFRAWCEVSCHGPESGALNIVVQY